MNSIGSVFSNLVSGQCLKNYQDMIPLRKALIISQSILVASCAGAVLSLNSSLIVGAGAFVYFTSTYGGKEKMKDEAIKAAEQDQLSSEKKWEMIHAFANAHNISETIVA